MTSLYAMSRRGKSKEKVESLIASSGRKRRDKNLGWGGGWSGDSQNRQGFFCVVNDS